MPSRLDTIVHYIIRVVPPEQLGATKLAKILWFSDVEHYRATGQTLTKSDDYRKRDQGPLHIDFYGTLSRLKNEAAIAERQVQTPAGLRREFLWLKHPDVSDFTGPELATLHSVIDQIRVMTAKEVSDLSHVEPWESAYDGEPLRVTAAAVQFGDVDDGDMAWAESEYHAVRATA